MKGHEMEALGRISRAQQQQSIHSAGSGWLATGGKAGTARGQHSTTQHNTGGEDGG